MAEFIATEENREEEQSSFDFAALWKIVVLYWYWIVLSAIVAVAAPSVTCVTHALYMPPA